MRAILAAACATALAVALIGSPQAPRSGDAGVEDGYRANNLGVARLEQFDYPAATASFREALEKQPGLAIARVNLAIALFYAGELPAARREAEAAAAALPSVAQPPYVSGLIARAENRTVDAVAAFTRVRELDPGDPGAATQLGQLLLQDRKYPEAVDLFRRAIDAEPYNATAAYGLAMALTRGGSRDEGAEAMARFQKLRDSAYATTYSQNYLEQGRYAEAISSTGAEAELVDSSTPKVTFTDVSSSALPPPPPHRPPHPPSPPTAAVLLVDVDADGDLDLLEADPESVRLYQNDGGRFTDVTTRAGLAGMSALRALAGDFDNDGAVDLLLIRDVGMALLRQVGRWRFADVTVQARLRSSAANPLTAAWLDADHDGDLDLLVGGSASEGSSSLSLARNNGNGTFDDVTAAAKLASKRRITTLAATDFDNRRDIDILAGTSEGPMLLRNMRDGSFGDWTGETGLSSKEPVSALAAADVNKDGYTDAFFGRPNDPGYLALSDGRGRFRVVSLPDTRYAHAAQFIDYDNDGLLDLLLIDKLIRNTGAAWVNVGAFGPMEDAEPFQAMAAGDIDGDGDTDVLLRGRHRPLRIWRNDGGSENRSLAVRLVARVSNRSALGSKVEIRAGSLRQKLESSAATPAVAPADLLFGLGARLHADVVRVLWPAGILQAEIPAAAGDTTLKGRATGALTIQELDRKPSSCPYLYTWNGERFEFVTDFLGGGELGYFVAPGVRSRPDPDEYVRIDGRQLEERDGRFELRVTNELEEALFLDRARLIAIDHPADVEVHPEEGLKATPPPFRLHAARGAAPPLAATDEHGHDVLDRLLQLDRRYPDDFAVERIRGYAGRHHLTLTLPASRDKERVLLLTGWTDYAFSSDNFAASQAGLRLLPPSLEIKDERGRWRTAIADVGVPVGRPQTVVVDLSKAVAPSVREVRISTTMRIYWDQIRVATSHSIEPVHLQSLEPAHADLRWRGFSAEATPDEPFRYDYDRVTPVSPWKLMPGRYTREGDVRPLLAATDDMFVVSRPGDEIALSFDARALRPVAAGRMRTFLLHADGFSKEMDLHSSSPDTVLPMPFHGMPEYPYAPPHAYPASDAHREYLERYNTRIVSRMLPPVQGDSHRFSESVKR